MAGSRAGAHREWMSRRRAVSINTDDPVALFASLLCTHLWLNRLADEGEEAWIFDNRSLVRNTNWMLARSKDSDSAIVMLRLATEIRNMISIADEPLKHKLLEEGRRWYRAKPKNYELRRILASVLARNSDIKLRAEGDRMTAALVRERPGSADIQVLPVSVAWYRVLIGKQTRATIDEVWSLMQKAKQKIPVTSGLARDYLPFVERNLREMYQKNKLRPPSG